MKKSYSHGLSAVLLLSSLGALAQPRPAGPTYSLGTTQGFVRELETQVAAGPARRQATTITLRVSATQAFTGKVNYREDRTTTGELVVGEIQGVPGASFSVRIDGPKVEGHIVLLGTKRAFRYSADAQGNAAVQEVDINQVLCVGYSLPAGYVAPKRASGGTVNRAATLALQSLPGARGCLLLDVDGYNMPAGAGWNNGKAYNAPPANMSDADVQATWELVSEDFRFLNLNVTTDENVYNAYPPAMRKRCVFSPGSRQTICPDAAGVATLNSFGDETPCWTFLTDNPKYAGETTSHEVGHTLGLSHDGRTPVEEYYSGKDRKNWAPIMGAGFSKPVSQWSKGDYGLASNKEDDLAIMSGPRNNLGYRSDDHANGTSGATALARSGNNVSGSGLIGSTTDQDYFSFTTSGGAVSLNVNTVDPYGNLDIVARLFDANGALLGTYDTPAPNINEPNLNATVSATLRAGTYFLQVDGTGSGDPATDGYSDYGSLGTFTIAGTIPAGTTPLSGTGMASLRAPLTFSVYPNPVADELLLGASQSLRGTQLQVLDAQGRTLHKGPGETGRLDVSALPAGVYTLRVLREGQPPVTKRFVK